MLHLVYSLSSTKAVEILLLIFWSYFFTAEYTAEQDDCPPWFTHLALDPTQPTRVELKVLDLVHMVYATVLHTKLSAVDDVYIENVSLLKVNFYSKQSSLLEISFLQLFVAYKTESTILCTHLLL